MKQIEPMNIFDVRLHDFYVSGSPAGFLKNNLEFESVPMSWCAPIKNNTACRGGPVAPFRGVQSCAWLWGRRWQGTWNGLCGKRRPGGTPQQCPKNWSHSHTQTTPTPANQWQSELLIQALAGLGRFCTQTKAFQAHTHANLPDKWRAPSLCLECLSLEWPKQKNAWHVPYFTCLLPPATFLKAEFLHHPHVAHVAPSAATAALLQWDALIRLLDGAVKLFKTDWTTGYWHWRKPACLSNYSSQK